MRALFRILSAWADVRALQRGRYPQRLVRNSAHRSLSRSMRRWGL